jgi:phenylacetate-CoA ligase
MSSAQVDVQPSADAGALEALDATVARARASALYAPRLRGTRVRSVDDLRRIPLTTREDLQRAGPHGSRAVPLEQVCHYGETSGTSGATNSTWLTDADFARNARRIADRHPDVFAPGRVILNRFPFMAAPAHLIQRIAQAGGGIAIPAGNINWDVPFPRALDLARTTGAQVLAGLPLEPIVLAQIVRRQRLDPTRATAFDTFFLGGAPLPPALKRRIERVWRARVVELYGSTETMLLGTSCREGSVHLETDLAFAELLRVGADRPAAPGEAGRLVVTTLGIEGSPLVRFDTGDTVRLLPPCACGDPRPALLVLGRESEAVELSGRHLYAYELIVASADAADAIDSSVFFAVVLSDRLLLRVESSGPASLAAERLTQRLPGVRVEVETVADDDLLDVEGLSRSPRVYKPVVVSDWSRPGRRILSVGEGMMEWPKLSPSEVWRWLLRALRRSARRRRLAHRIRPAGSGTRPLL